MSKKFRGMRVKKVSKFVSNVYFTLHSHIILTLETGLLVENYMLNSVYICLLFINLFMQQRSDEDRKKKRKLNAHGK
jgi:hypothetical protein